MRRLDISSRESIISGFEFLVFCLLGEGDLALENCFLFLVFDDSIVISGDGDLLLTLVVCLVMFFAGILALTCGSLDLFLLFLTLTFTNDDGESSNNANESLSFGVVDNVG